MQDAATAAAARTEVLDLYCRAYVDRIASGDPFGDPEAFMRRFDSYVANSDLAMVIAVRSDRRVGQAWGWPLTAGSRWWQGLLGEPEPGFSSEDGHRTFALSEIMVDKEHAGRGIARSLHDRLLGSRKEPRATLLVNPGNTRARDTYLRWGWTRAGRLRPGWPNASLLDVLVRPSAHVGI